jgi:hypothetical protein
MLHVDQPQQAVTIACKKRRLIEQGASIIEGSVRMGSQRKDTEEVYVVLSRDERAIVKAIQSRRPGEPPIAWKATANNLKVSKTYLQAICTIPLKENSNEIPMSQIEHAKWTIALRWTSLDN